MVMNLKEEFGKMQLRLTWLVLVLFAVGIMSIGIVGCGGDTEEESAEKPTESSSSTTSEEPAVAARPPIDFAAEKAAIQAVYSEFYKAFNDERSQSHSGTPFGRVTAKVAFGTIFAGNEPVPIAFGWANIKVAIPGLWERHRHKGCEMGTE